MFPCRFRSIRMLVCPIKWVNMRNFPTLLPRISARWQRPDLSILREVAAELMRIISRRLPTHCETSSREPFQMPTRSCVYLVSNHSSSTAKRRISRTLESVQMLLDQGVLPVSSQKNNMAKPFLWLEDKLKAGQRSSI